MTQQAQSYLRGAYPPPLRMPIELPTGLKPRELPRCFLVKWNNSKGKGRRRDETWHDAYGTKYPNGRVTLDFGPPYESMSELQEMLDIAGENSIAFLDEAEAAKEA
jgi:hypothetical protein